MPPATGEPAPAEAGGKKVVKFGSANVAWTWYVRDAQGNVMGVYTAAKDTVATDTTLSPFQLQIAEHHIYGSSRLGVSNLSGQDAEANLSTAPGNLTITRGERFYELSNHLGNVLAVISDKKMGHTSNNSSLDYYNPDIVSVTDYYPFGMVSRSAYLNNLNLNYRYSFNGKENDKDVKGDGNQIDYGMRIYDPRLGKFLSVDPLTKKYPHLTSYQFASNSPIKYIDLDGLEAHAHWYDYDFNDFMNWLGRSDNTVKSINRGEGPIGEKLKSFNYNINPVGIVYFNSYTLVTGKDDYGRPASRVDAAGNLIIAGIFHQAGTRLAAPSATVQLERQMGKPGVAVETISSDQTLNTSTGSQTFSESGITLKHSTPQIGDQFRKINYKFDFGRGTLSTGTKRLTGTYDFVVTNEGKLVIGNGHYYLSGEASSVKAAGQMQIFEGKIKNINNWSGHYMPTPEEAKNFGSILKEAGANVSNANLNIYDAAGNKLPTIKL